MSSLEIINTCEDADPSVRTLSVVASDRGLAYGHGVFETMLCLGGTVPLIRRHLNRLQFGAERLGIPFLAGDIRSAIDSVTVAYSGIIKIILTAGCGGTGYQSPSVVKPRLIISKRQLPADIDKQRQCGIKLWCCHQQLSTDLALAGIKHLNRLEQVLASNEIPSDLCSDGIMFDSTGNVIETTSANIFLKHPSEGWTTPSLENCGVAGVMRSMLLDEIFPTMASNCGVGLIDQGALNQSCEIFICNSIRGIIPVIGVMNKDHTVRTLSIGRDTMQLQTVLKNQFPFVS